jgi:hypothetical protein
MTTALCYLLSRRWDEEDWKKLGPTAFTGIDDTKLFVWPGKGLFALVTRRAEAHSPTDVACKRHNFMQYLAQVLRAGPLLPSCVHSAPIWLWAFMCR